MPMAIARTTGLFSRGICIGNPLGLRGPVARGRPQSSLLCQAKAGGSSAAATRWALIAAAGVAYIEAANSWSGRTDMPGLWKFRYVLCGLAALGFLALAVAEADAARRSGGGFGSRGNRTYQAPPPTQTAPNTAAPINRSVTQPQAQRPGT